MEPRLVCVSGIEPKTINLHSNEFTIGRDSVNGLQLDDPTVSSRHCLIERKSDGFTLVDCNSTNGTFVNGKGTLRMKLNHGDEISIGSSRFYFLTNDDPVPTHEIQIDEGNDDNLVSTETKRLALSDSGGRRSSHQLSLLLQLSTEINHVESSEKLQNVLLSRIFEFVPVQDGVILLGTDVHQLFAGGNVQRRRVARESHIRVSRSIVEQVLISGEAILRNDLLANSPTESVIASGIQSVLCVPLTIMNTTTGILYLSTTNPRTPFDESHLRLVTAIASIAAIALEHARYVEWLEVENQQLTHEANLRHEMIGNSPKMKMVYEAISRIASTDSPVLILGESGTGKELAARAIHNNSTRRNGPFIAVNCGAITESLFSSALFGHIKGAFTGADRDQKGFIEEADGGSLFLDELGDLPTHCQAALLRVLEEQQIRRVGSLRQIPVNIRLISATNHSLTEDIQKGRFRSDLYYRMGLPLELPPLRDRLDDLPLLVRFFIQKHRNNTQREIGATPPNTIRVLQEYHWPGNLRELSNAIRWAVVFGKSDRIRPEDLPPDVRKSESNAETAVGSLDQAMEKFERQFIIRALEEARGNVVEAAALLARAPNYLQRRISQLDLRDELERIRSESKNR